MNAFVESMRRLFQEGFVTKEKIMELYKNKKLTVEEVNFILDSNNDSNEN